ncbi:hypothetical protein HWV23_14610 [Natronomonas halophila]|nr:hypothetical protein HWV23_14610 [Natronomonas halophila]
MGIDTNIPGRWRVSDTVRAENSRPKLPKNIELYRNHRWVFRDADTRWG